MLTFSTQHSLNTPTHLVSLPNIRRTLSISRPPGPCTDTEEVLFLRTVGVLAVVVGASIATGMGIVCAACTGC